MPGLCHYAYNDNDNDSFVVCFDFASLYPTPAGASPSSGTPAPCQSGEEQSDDDEEEEEEV